MANFLTQGNEELADLYISESEIFERYVGNQLWTWGYNEFYGRLGTNNEISRSSPVQTVSGGTNWKQIELGDTITAAIKTDGTLWLWGQNDNGQLGINSIASRSSPVQTVSGGTNWYVVSAGGYSTAAIKTDGTLWLWGLNDRGQLGDNTRLDRSSPVQTTSAGTNWKQVNIGDLHIAAIKTDGTLWMWGANGYGELGQNTSIDRSSPVQTVSTGTNWKQVSAGGSHTAAIKTDGTLWLWGSNGYGQLGQNTSIDRSSPVQTISTGTNWKQVSSGFNFTTAIKTDGTLWVWGDNTYGQLGSNSVVSRSSPIQTVSAGVNWKQVSTGYNFVSAIKTDGTLWLWGNNPNGQLGDNTKVTRSSPVQTASRGYNWKQVSAGGFHTVAITITES